MIKKRREREREKNRGGGRNKASTMDAPNTPGNMHETKTAHTSIPGIHYSLPPPYNIYQVYIYLALSYGIYNTSHHMLVIRGGVAHTRRHT